MRTVSGSSGYKAKWFFISFLMMGLLILTAVIFLSLIYAAPAGLVLGSALFSLHLSLQASLALSSFFTLMLVSGLIALVGVVAGIGGLRVNSQFKTFQKSGASVGRVEAPRVATATSALAHSGGAALGVSVESSLAADQKEFLRLIKKGTDEECLNFLKAHRRFDVNYIDENGYTPHLWSAVRRNDLKGTRNVMAMWRNARYVLGVRGAVSLELSTQGGGILLTKIIQKNDIPIFEALLNTRPMPDQIGLCELECYLASFGCLDMLKLLFEKYKSENVRGWLEVGARFKKDTPLIAAARNGHVEVVEYLLGEGADKEYCNAKGENALAVARAENHTQVIAFLEGRLSSSHRPS